MGATSAGTTGTPGTGVGTNAVSTSSTGAISGAGGAASTGTPATGSTGMGAGGAMGTNGPSTGGGQAGATSTNTASTTGGLSEGERSPEGVCQRWNADRADLGEGTWSGSVESCEAGDISPEGRANALRLYNLYRWLADLPAVTTDPERDRMAQECALMMEANNSLSHSPPMNWTCWTEAGAEGASSSNLSSGPGVRSADGYMMDPGNETTIGHRRWILSNSLGPIGLGSTATGASCMQNLRGQGNADKPWVAWPPPGAFPMEAYGNGRTTLSDTGWTVQSDELDLSDAQVSVGSAGSALPVSVTQLQGGYGSRQAFRFNPMGWEPTAGQTYSVSVTGISEPLSYDVHMVACE